MCILFPSLAILDVGGTEIMMIMLVTLLLFGSKRMPDLARSLGKSIREFKKAASSLEEELKRALEVPPPPPQSASMNVAAIMATLIDSNALFTIEFVSLIDLSTFRIMAVSASQVASILASVFVAQRLRFR